MKRTFRVKRDYPKILRNRKARIERRLAPRNWCDQPEPMLRGGNLHYEVAERAGAVGCGGIGAMHTMVQRLGLVKEIDQELHLPSRFPALPTPLVAHPEESLVELNRIILRACDVDSEQRYQSSKELQADLLELQRRLGGNP